jgi:hypothetical protein
MTNPHILPVDREAAAALLPDSEPFTRLRMLDGARDDHPFVVSHARHREAAIKAAAETLELALPYVRTAAKADDATLADALVLAKVKAALAFFLTPEASHG